MNPLKNLPIVYAVFALFFTLVAVAAIGQTRVEGSRPGETYRVGETAPQQQAPSPQQAAPPQYPTGYQVAPHAQTPLPVQGQMQQGTTPQSGTPVIMEFSDLQCPDSARFNSGLKNTIMQRFVGDGKAKYEWHDFPLPSHPQAPEAAAAARCAGASADRMRQMIMSNQGQMSANVYIQYARQLGLDTDKFTECLRSGATMREVQNDRQLGQSFGVRGTPTLVLGTTSGSGNVTPVKVVKAYDPPEQVLAEIENFMAQTASAGTAQ